MEGKCQFCSTSLSGLRTGAKFCSDRCRAAYKRKDKELVPDKPAMSPLKSKSKPAASVKAEAPPVVQTWERELYQLYCNHCGEALMKVSYVFKNTFNCCDEECAAAYHRKKQGLPVSGAAHHTSFLQIEPTVQLSRSEFDRLKGMIPMVKDDGSPFAYQQFEKQVQAAAGLTEKQKGLLMMAVHASDL